MKKVFFFFVLFYHGLTVPCASVREHTSDKIPVVAHRIQFESPVSSSRSKIHNAANGWFSPDIPQAGAAG